MLKANRYAAAGLENHWIVDPRAGTFSAYRLSGALFSPLVHLTQADAPSRVTAGPVEALVDVGALLA